MGLGARANIGCMILVQLDPQGYQGAAFAEVAKDFFLAVEEGLYHEVCSPIRERLRSL